MLVTMKIVVVLQLWWRQVGLGLLSVLTVAVCMPCNLIERKPVLVAEELLQVRHLWSTGCQA